MRRISATSLTFCIFSALAAGCQQPQSGGQRGNISVNANEILDRCVGTFARFQSLRAEGMLRDLRAKNRDPLPVIWDFARPGRCRVQIGREVAVVVGDDWWIYDSASGQFRKHKSFTKTPMETAAFLLSKGVSFLLPAVFSRGEAAFAKSRLRGYVDWKLLGVAWSSERPCYVVGRTGQGRDRAAMLRVWIDQDSYLIRGWDLTAIGANGRESTVLECMYAKLSPNEAIPADRFSLTAPARTAAAE